MSFSRIFSNILERGGPSVAAASVGFMSAGRRTSAAYRAEPVEAVEPLALDDAFGMSPSFMPSSRPVGLGALLDELRRLMRAGRGPLAASPELRGLLDEMRRGRGDPELIEALRDEPGNEPFRALLPRDLRPDAEPDDYPSPRPSW